MSEYDEGFRKRLDVVFRSWIEKLRPMIAEMIEGDLSVDRKEVEKLTQGVVAMLEGGILLLKSRQDLEVLKNVIKLARSLVKLKGL